jgi:hypothetical protein
MTSRTASRALVAVALGALAGVAVGGRLGAADEPAKGEEAKQRLKDMTRSAAQHALASADAARRTFAFREAALLRSSNPVSGTKDGAIFLWTDRGRPQVALKVFTFDNKSYSHAWLSLSEGPLTAARGGRVIWKPAEPGVAFREVPDAPAPAGSAVGRLRQMRELAGAFTATYTARHLDNKPFELRLLPQPVYRYEGDDAKADGAVFVFVQSTAAVALLVLESRPARDGRRWHAAVASLVSGPVAVKHGDKGVASIEKDYSSADRTKPYLQLHGQPVPKE